MKKQLKILLGSILCIFLTQSSFGQINHTDRVIIKKNNYGPKLTLDDPNTANKVPIEWRSNNVIKWELGQRPAAGLYDLALWRQNAGYKPTMWFSHDTGYVGIGTSQPSAELEILSNGAYYSSYKSTLKIKDQTNRGTMILESIADKPTDFVFRNNNRRSWLISSRDSSNDYSLNFFGASNGNVFDFPTLSLLTNGSVGVNTLTTGTHKLAVNGSIGAREVKVETGTWSDFVFNKDYELPTLKEVEQHILEKGHLQDIPSAAEVEKNGVYLGEMDAKLLQKIEELMLYTIQQQKEIEVLKGQLKEFRK